MKFEYPDVYEDILYNTTKGYKNNTMEFMKSFSYVF